MEVAECGGGGVWRWWSMEVVNSGGGGPYGGGEQWRWWTIWRW